MKISAAPIAIAVCAALLAAPSAWANIPAQSGPEKAEDLWLGDVQARLQRRVDRDMPISGSWVSEIRFDVGPEGVVREPSLVSPSGSRAADGAALRAVQGARGLQPPPATLAGRPVLFRLVVAGSRPVLRARR